MKFSVNFALPPEKKIYGYRSRSSGMVYWLTKGRQVAFFDTSSGGVGPAAIQNWDGYADNPATYEPIYEPFTITIGA